MLEWSIPGYAKPSPKVEIGDGCLDNVDVNNDFTPVSNLGDLSLTDC